MTDWLKRKRRVLTAGLAAVAIAAPAIGQTAEWSIRPLDAVKTEGDAGTTPFTFVVERSGNASEAATVMYSVHGSGDNQAGKADFSSDTMDGTVVAWGNNDDGQTDVPAGLDDVVSIAAGEDHTVALRLDGTVVAWGDNDWGQTDVPTGLDNVMAIAAGDGNTVALRLDGTVVAWGYNGFGQTDVPAGLDNVVSVAAGVRHTVALRADGTVVAWGYNGFGQTDVPAGLADVVSIAAGYSHTGALHAGGRVVAWGNIWSGHTFVPIGLDDVVTIAAGDGHMAALRADGKVVAWGNNWSGQTAVPAGLADVVSIAAGGSHTVALRADRTVAAWGSNWSGQTDVPADLDDVISIAAGSSHTVALRADGSVAFAPGQTSKTLTIDVRGDLEPEPDESFTVLLHVPSPSTGNRLNVVTTEGAILNDDQAAEWSTRPLDAVKAEGDAGATPFTFAVERSGDASEAATVMYSVHGSGDNQAGKADFSSDTMDGTVVAWGNNDDGQTDVPAGLDDVVSIAAGEDHTVALRLDGTVVAWGDNDWGQTDVPAGLDNVVAIAAGDGNTVALRLDGTVVAWGRNGYGQTDVPAGLDNVVSIAAGGGHTVALRSDGTVVAWGYNGFGQTDAPAGLADVVSIVAGVGHTVALRSDGTVVAWGYNGDGQTDVPAGLNDVVSIAARRHHTVALRSDGTVVAWGYNHYGQTDVPADLGEVVSIAADSSHTVALRSDGTVVAWGRNDNGQADVPAVQRQPANRLALFCRNDNGQADVPAGLDGVVSIAAGGSHTVALRVDGSVAFAPGETSKTLTIDVRGDLEPEPDESFAVLLHVPSPSAGNRLNVITTEGVIRNDDQADIAVYAEDSPMSAGERLDFGNVLFSSTAARRLQVRNLGNIDLENVRATISGEQAADFSVLLPVAGLSPGAAADLTVRFTPKGAENHSAVLRLFSSDPDENPFMIALQGNGQAADIAIGMGEDSISDGERLDFGDVLFGSTSERHFQVRNLGDADLVDLRFVVSGEQAAEFELVEPSVVSLAPGESLDLTARFTPKGAGNRSAVLRLFSNDPDENPFTIALQGNGRAADIAIEVEGASNSDISNGGSWDLGDVSFGLSSVTEGRLQVRNRGNIDLENLRFVVSGEQAAEFELVEPSVDSLSPGESLDLTVRFLPAGVGSRSALLAIFSNDPDENPFAITLRGNGIIAAKLAAGSVETRPPNFVTVGFRILDPAGVGLNLPEELVKQEVFFDVQEDGVALSPSESFLQTAKVDEVPSVIRTALMLDNGFSTVHELPAIKAAAKRLIAEAAPGQEFAVYSFSSAVGLLQDFTADSALLNEAIDAVAVGQASTDLYGAIQAGVARWTDSTNLDGVVRGFLVVLTDGRDTTGRHTLEETLAARGNRQVFTVGLGAEMDPAVLRQLGNAGFFGVSQSEELEGVFAAIQQRILADANSFYCLNYASPKRGDAARRLTVGIKGNTYRGSDAVLEVEFNSRDFTDLAGGVRVNRDIVHPGGLERIEIAGDAPFLAEAFTVLSAFPPAYTWELADSSVARIAALEDNCRIELHPLANGETTLTVTDTANAPLLGSAYRPTLRIAVSGISVVRPVVKLFLPQRVSGGGLVFSFGYSDGSAMGPGDEARFWIRSTADFRSWRREVARLRLAGGVLSWERPGEAASGRYFQVLEKPRED